MPSSALLSTEFRQWKTKFASVPPDKRPNTLVEALKACDEDAFPKLYVLLVVACTLPVTTCETEGCNSQLKLLKTYLRSTMTEQRLFALAMIKVHHRIVEELDFDKLVVDFANQHPRRMTLPCVAGAGRKRTLFCIGQIKLFCMNHTFETSSMSS